MSAGDLYLLGKSPSRIELRSFGGGTRDQHAVGAKAIQSEALVRDVTHLLRNSQKLAVRINSFVVPLHVIEGDGYGQVSLAFHLHLSGSLARKR